MSLTFGRSLEARLSGDGERVLCGWPRCGGELAKVRVVRPADTRAACILVRLTPRAGEEPSQFYLVFSPHMRWWPAAGIWAARPYAQSALSVGHEPSPARSRQPAPEPPMPADATPEERGSRRARRVLSPARGRPDPNSAASMQRASPTLPCRVECPRCHRVQSIAERLWS